MVEIIGVVYSLLFAGCYIPQIIKMIQTKNVEGISIGMYWVCIAAYALAIVYTLATVGIATVFILNYGSGLIFCLLTIIFYYRYKKKLHP